MHCFRLTAEEAAPAAQAHRALSPHFVLGHSHHSYQPGLQIQQAAVLSSVCHLANTERQAANTVEHLAANETDTSLRDQSFQRLLDLSLLSLSPSSCRAPSVTTAVSYCGVTSASGARWIGSWRSGTAGQAPPQWSPHRPSWNRGRQFRLWVEGAMTWLPNSVFH